MSPAIIITEALIGMAVTGWVVSNWRLIWWGLEGWINGDPDTEFWHPDPEVIKKVEMSRRKYWDGP